MFLEGYALGANLGSNSAHSKLTPFLSWVAKKQGHSKVKMTWSDFLDIYDSDEEALRALKFLFTEYASEYLEGAPTR
ncbi:MAG: hypothetical protein DWQ47_09585 [Acidobacteria bacterium]|nr:MAG: hypothetical protein DWQ32_17685 [Acidobacteriota bacterium]REJ98849.1 MAG: hypothetical protein DWQ38_12290 [Acidobacteriota bacterium]REK16431.1 MAG: hypothetical protein DWQ43_05395 [Acidobacteriota bacterium]REK44112.1 MAG: hypothetical protein DWQ47_09585 [Acidobacteriota bacterium]